MQITRQNHLRYMAKITPLLLILYVAQAYLYRTYAPAHLVSDMNLFMGIGLAFIILCYHFYDLHHQIICHENYIEIIFDLLRMKEEILYSNIVHVEVKRKKHAFGHLEIHDRNGQVFQLHHVDAPEEIQRYIEMKKTKKI